jgi:hypothetical protein
VATVTVVDKSVYSFRSAASGNWSSSSTWEQSTNGGASWDATSATPDFSNSNITVRAGHVVSVVSPVVVDDLVIAAGGEVRIGAAVFTITNVTAGVDCDVFGTLTVSNVAGSSLALQNTPAVVFETGGRFVHARTAAPVAAVPAATWSTGSTCEIQGSSGTPTGIGQAFYNFVWNYPTAAASTDFVGGLTTVQGSLDVSASNNATAGALKLYGPSATTVGSSLTLTVNRHVNLNAGYFDLLGGSGTNNSQILNVGGNFNIATGATLDIRNSGPGCGAYINFTNTGGSQTFTNGGNITHSSGSGANKIVWGVNPGCTLNIGPGALVLRTNDYLTGGGTVTVSSTGGLEGNGTNRIAAALGTINYGGTLTLDNLPVFAGGESFQLFDATNRAGAFSAIVPALPGAGLSWDTSQLVSGGILKVSGGGGGGAGLRITSAVLAGANFILGGSGGTTNGNYEVLSSTNVATARASWPSVGTSQFDGSGNFSFTNTPAGGGAERYYLIHETP